MENADVARVFDEIADLARKLHVLVESGRLPVLEALLAKVPEALVAFMRVEGLGPRRAA
jgi:DNA polymerase (family 10)